MTDDDEKAIARWVEFRDQPYERVGADPRVAILSRIAREYNVAIYEIGSEVTVNLFGKRQTFELEPSDVGYHP